MMVTMWTRIGVSGERHRWGGEAALVTPTLLMPLLAQPVVAYAVAAGLLGASGTPLLAIVATAALLTAQNIYVHASRYDRSVGLARDTILIPTSGSAPVILLAVLLSS